MTKSKFVYATYIRSTPEKLWEALLRPEFTRAYWFGITLDCTWTQGAPWRMVHPDGRVTDSGEIVEIEQQKRIPKFVATRIPSLQAPPLLTAR